MIVRPVQVEAFLAGSGLDQRQKLHFKGSDSACVLFKFIQTGGISSTLHTVHYWQVGRASKQ